VGPVGCSVVIIFPHILKEGSKTFKKAFSAGLSKF
jgi:hypothetical protein